MRFAAVVLLAACAAGYAAEMSNAQLEQIAGDRTGACSAVAVIENDNVAGRFACAADQGRTRSDANPGFEIGMRMHSSGQRDAAMMAQLTFALDHDDAGDFVATQVAAELRLERDAVDAVMVLALLALTLLQAGRYLHGTRL